MDPVDVHPFGGAMFLFLSVVVTAVLSFIAVMVWLAHRKSDRDQYYRTETMKKIAESGSAAAAIEYVRETDRLERRRMRDGMRLGGLIAIAAGIGLIAFLAGIADEGQPVHLVGTIPLFVGIVLFVYAQFMTRRD